MPARSATRSLSGASMSAATRLEAMNRAIELHALRPVIDRVFGFRETIQAFRYFEECNHIGKIVIAGD
jgi:NADPH:quinone reductase-like Zn-dependent oxidoreductase